MRCLTSRNDQHPPQLTIAENEPTQEDEKRGEHGREDRAAARSHRREDERRDEGAEQGGQRAHGDIRHAAVDVRVADILKLEAAVIAREPGGARQKELRSASGGGVSMTAQPSQEV